jgi:squamous cell carcinoma antigen recognized by T-cells 3
MEGGLHLVVKISDPSKKQDRTGAQYEGREIIVRNLAWTATEDEVKEFFRELGTVETVRVPRGVGGKSQGVAFVVFATKVGARSGISIDQALIRIAGRSGSCCSVFKPQAFQG